MKYFYVDTTTGMVNGLCDYIPELPSHVTLHTATAEQEDLILRGFTAFSDGELTRPKITNIREAQVMIRSALSDRLNFWAVDKGFSSTADAMSFSNSKTANLKSQATFAISVRDAIFVKSKELADSLDIPVSKDELDSKIDTVAKELGI